MPHELKKRMDSMAPHPSWHGIWSPVFVVQVRPRGVARLGTSRDVREGVCGEERSKLS
jgi:hypothetical protein